MRRPLSVRVNGRDYKIRRLPIEDSGECDYNKAVITASSHLDPFDLRDAVLHEVMHAVLYQQGRENAGPVEELYVRALATGIVGVFQDNPQFAAWLAEPIKRKSK